MDEVPAQMTEAVIKMTGLNSLTVGDWNRNFYFI